MGCNPDLPSKFFIELKHYNSSCFKTIEKSDMDIDDPVIYKACSSVVTRYFIFREKHPEVSEVEMKMLYYRLKIDMIARYFSQYPAGDCEDLKPFQKELQIYAEEMKRKYSDNAETKVEEVV